LCGRVAQAKNPTEYGSMLKIDFTKAAIPNAPAHYNGAPGQDYLIARLQTDSDDITLDMIRWGLLPPWAKDKKMAWKMINARAETVTTSAAFKKAFAKRRCLVPVDGFFEWEKVGKEKRPYMIAMLDRRPFTLAGLWENWKNPETGEWERTFTIVTTEANDLVAELHDRMPVIIAPDDHERWLKGPNPQELLKPYPAEQMTMWAVSPKLNSPKNDSADLLEPIGDGTGAPEGEVPRANEGEPEREPTNSE
jgi:putative SOS response-associated peptidase YedK